MKRASTEGAVHSGCLLMQALIGGAWQFGELCSAASERAVITHGTASEYAYAYLNTTRSGCSAAIMSRWNCTNRSSSSSAGSADLLSGLSRAAAWGTAQFGRHPACGARPLNWQHRTCLVALLIQAPVLAIVQVSELTCKARGEGAELPCAQPVKMVAGGHCCAIPVPKCSCCCNAEPHLQDMERLVVAEAQGRVCGWGAPAGGGGGAQPGACLLPHAGNHTLGYYRCQHERQEGGGGSHSAAAATKRVGFCAGPRRGAAVHPDDAMNGRVQTSLQDSLHAGGEVAQ